MDNENDQNISWCFVWDYNLHSMMAWVFRHQLEHTTKKKFACFHKTLGSLGQHHKRNSGSFGSFGHGTFWEEQPKKKRRKEKNKGKKAVPGQWDFFFHPSEMGTDTLSCKYCLSNSSTFSNRPDVVLNRHPLMPFLCADRWKSKATPGSGRNLST